MNVIILAAGQCTRLRPHTENTPKCLLQVGGMSILYRQLDMVVQSPHDKILIVVGYKCEMIERAVASYRGNIRIIHNKDFLTTNNGYSLELALNTLGDEPFMLLNGDVCCSPQLIYKLMNYKHRNAGACVRKNVNIPEDMKVVINPFGQIIDVGKTITNNSYGEFTGCAKFNIEGTKTMRKHLKLIGKNDWFEHALANVIKEIPFYAVDVSEHKFIEIDFLEDLEKARRMF
jgi:choline kinase